MSVSVRFRTGVGTLVTMRSYLLLATLASALLAAWACERDQYINGCKIYGNICKCGYGCRSEFIYKTRRACNNELRERFTGNPYSPIIPQPVQTAPPPAPERSGNICYNMPCLRGICIQTANEPGFACKCDGTGFYGLRCERVCPSYPFTGIVPHECIII